MKQQDGNVTQDDAQKKEENTGKALVEASVEMSVNENLFGEVEPPAKRSRTEEVAGAASAQTTIARSTDTPLVDEVCHFRT